MTYPTHPSPKKGDFFLAPISGIGGRGIRLGEAALGYGWVKIQHAGIYLGGTETLEAMPGGAIIGDIDRFDPESLVWSTDSFDLTDIQREMIHEIAIGYEGTPYSWADYAALALHRFHLWVPGLKYFIMTSGHMICSQLVDRVYYHAGIHLFEDGRWDGYVTPPDLLNLLNQRENYRLAMGL